MEPHPAPPSAPAPGPSAAERAELDKSGRAIRDMFAAVAPRYDLLNHLLSASLDRWWRRRASRALAAEEGRRVLDLCCGTGDQAVSLGRSGAEVAAAADFCLPMLALAQPKLAAGRGPGAAAPPLAAADALALPFPTGAFSAATVSFGLRNVADLDRALGELARTLAPGGRLLVLEFAVPTNPVLSRLYLLYFRRLLPLVGRLLSARGSAYSYLPASVLDFPQRRGFLDRMRGAGLRDLEWRDLSFGIVCLYSGRKP